MIKIKMIGFNNNFSDQAKSELLISWQPGLTPMRLLQLLSLQKAQIGVILIDGRIEDIDCLVNDRSTVEFYPIFGGG